MAERSVPFNLLGRMLRISCIAVCCISARCAFASEALTAASISEGQRLMAENHCNGACHQTRAVSSDPLALYTRSTRRVNSIEELRRQVESCVARLAAPIFPDDIEHVVTALDHDAYRFDWPLPRPTKETP